MRLDKIKNDPLRDSQRMQELAALQAPWLREVAARKGVADQRLEEFRWLLEELRVSLFAQELRTPMPVSASACRKPGTRCVASRQALVSCRRCRCALYRRPPNRPPPNRSPKLPALKRLPQLPLPPPQPPALTAGAIAPVAGTAAERSQPPPPQLLVRSALLRACCSRLAQSELDALLQPLLECCCQLPLASLR